jgi:hypothetical protein
MESESTRVPHLNHLALVVGILLQLPTIMLPRLRASQTTLILVHNFLSPSKLDEGIRLMPPRRQQRIPMLLLLPRTSKVIDDLALEPDLPNPNPPNHQHLIHPEETEAKKLLLLATKEMT